MSCRHCLAILLCLLAASSTFAEDPCNRPEAPASIPDGATAGEQAMIEASRVVNRFVTEGDDYIQCLLPQIDEAKALVEQTEGTEQHETASILLVKLIRMHDSMVDEMQAAANAFNLSVKAYNAQ